MKIFRGVSDSINRGGGEWLTPKKPGGFLEPS